MCDPDRQLPESVGRACPLPGMEVVARIIPDSVIQRRAVVSGRVFAALECITEEQKQTVMQMSRDVAVPQLRRIARMICGWRTPKCGLSRFTRSTATPTGSSPGTA